MTADEARKLNDKYAAEQMISVESINSEIKKAAMVGKSSVSISLLKIDWSYRTRTYETLSSHFKNKGFKVNRNSWSDPRERDSGDSIVISW